MAAVIDLTTARRVPQTHRSDRHAPAGRPALRLVTGGLDPVRPAANPADRPRPRPVADRRHERELRLRRTYLQRRVVAAAVALVVLFAGAKGLSVLTSAAGLAAVPVAEETYRVRPGDTLWSVAGRLAPERDPRLVVDDLAALNGGSLIRVGQELRLPASLG